MDGMDEREAAGYPVGLAIAGKPAHANVMLEKTN
jgi:hypothetical protein